MHIFRRLNLEYLTLTTTDVHYELDCVLEHELLNCCFAGADPKQELLKAEHGTLGTAYLTTMYFTPAEEFAIATFDSDKKPPDLCPSEDFFPPN